MQPRLCLSSIRCSEDLNVDVRKIARATLAGNVIKILESRLPKVSAPVGLSIQQFSAPKQTNTVQRWKATLLIGASPVSTKVEFSRRGIDSGVVQDLIDSRITAAHQIPPFVLPHYALEAAVRQKAAALAGRPLTQARDVFDLHFLFSQGGVVHLKEVPREVLAKAAEMPSAFRTGIIADKSWPTCLPTSRPNMRESLFGTRCRRLSSASWKRPTEIHPLHDAEEPMDQTKALAKLRSQYAAAFTTRDAAALLSVTVNAASKLLDRLASVGLIVRIMRGPLGHSGQI